MLSCPPSPTSAGAAWAQGLDPALPWLDQTISAEVNIDDYCNAYSDGSNMYFSRRAGLREHRAAGRRDLPRVRTLAPRAVGPDGAGAFDGALSEGWADYVSATITGDPDVAIGFFYTSDPLRDIDPAGFEYVWPYDIDEIHYTGQIVAGALWDLRKELVASLARAPGWLGPTCSATRP